MSGVRCGYCRKRHPSSADVWKCARDHEFRTDASPDAQDRVQTVAQAEALTKVLAPRFADLLDGIKVARGNDRWDLIESLSDMALAAVTGVTPQWGVAYVARQLVIARVQGVPLDEMHDHLREIAESLKANPSEVGSVARAVTELGDELGKLATMLADDSPASMVSAGSRLRKLDRPDLAIDAASIAVERDPTNFAAITVRGAAQADLGDMRSALTEATRAERMRPSSYTANLLARVHTQQEDLSAARDWAMKANSRDPEGMAGAGSLMKIAAINGDRKEAEFWSSKVPWSTDSSSSEHWLKLVAAKELVRGPRREEAAEILTDLWVNHDYEPARSILLEEFGYVPPRQRTSS